LRDLFELEYSKRTSMKAQRLSNEPARRICLVSALVFCALGMVSHAQIGESQVVAWGSNSSGQTNLPPGLTNVVAIAAGASHALALTREGTLVAWGSGAATSIPPDLTNVVAIAASVANSLALRADGIVMAWGAGPTTLTNVPPELSNVVAIAAGQDINVALRANGQIIAWGTSSWGLNNPPASVTPFVSIAAGAEHGLAADADGRVIPWGRSSSGQTNVPPAATNVIAVAAGTGHSLALRSDGVVLAWGLNHRGQTSVPATASNVVAIAGAGHSSMALRNDGEVIVWGETAGGLTQVPATVTNAAAICAGGTFSMALMHDGLEVFQPPATRIVTAGSDQVFMASSVATVPVHHQWLFEEIPIAGATNRWLAMTGVQAPQAGHYAVRVQSGWPVVTSAPALLSVEPSPPGVWLDITNRPWLAGSVSRLQPGVHGSAPLHFQWQLNGTDLPGATNQSLEISNVLPSHAGSYQLLISNSLGTATSAVAAVTVREVLGWTTSSGYPLTNAPGGATNLIMVELGTSTAVALRSDGRPIVWGTIIPSLNNVPASATNVTSVSAGADHILALRSDGMIVGWGATSKTQQPAFVSNVVDIAAGYGHSLAVRSDRSVVAWGLGGAAVTNVPAAVREVVQISASKYHTTGFSVALRRDGSVIAWGANPFGVTNVPPEVTNIEAVAAGHEHIVALRADGTVVVWGRYADDVGTPPASATNVVAVAAASGQSFALRHDGTVIAWGINSSGQTNVPPNLEFAVGITANSQCALAHLGSAAPQFLRPSRNLLAYRGDDYHLNAGVVGREPLSYQWRHEGADIPGANGPSLLISNVQDSSAGSYSVVVSNALGWAEQEVAVLDVDESPVAPAFTLHPASQTVFAGTNPTLTAAASGYPAPTYQWMWNGTNIAGATNASYSIPYVRQANAGTYTVRAENFQGFAVSDPAVLTVEIPPWPTFVSLPVERAVSMGAPFTLSVSVTGTPPVSIQWQRNGVDLPGFVGASIAFGGFTAGDGGVYSVVASNASGVSTSAVFRVLATPVAVWGVGPVTNLPVELSKAISIAAGAQHALALLEDGSVKAWGTNNVEYVFPPGVYVTNNDGQLDVPAGLSNVVAIAAGHHHNLALTANGRVTAWGRNSSGQSSVPASATNIVAIAAGLAHSLALRADGRVIAWGANTNGQVTVPASATNVIAIAAGANHSLALRADGTPVAWGLNTWGQANVPASATNLVAISAGTSHSGGIRAQGTALYWGSALSWFYWPGDSFSQFPFPGSSSPSGLSGVASGHNHSLVVASDGRVGVFTSSFSPQPHEAVPTWLRYPQAVAGGLNFSMALLHRADGLPFFAGPSRSGLFGGTAVFPAFGHGERVAKCQWRKDSFDLAGATNTFLLLTNLQPHHAGAYTVNVTDAAGSLTSAPALLELLPPPIPTIVQQPVSVEAGAGSGAAFNVLAEASIPASYQWTRNGSPIAGAIQPALMLHNVQSSNAGDYRVILSNYSGAITSAVATLTVTSTIPSIVTQPASVNVALGGPMMLSVLARGSEPISFQWKRDGVPLPAGTQPVWMVSASQASDAGDYQVVVSNLHAAVTSAVARVTVTPLSFAGDAGSWHGVLPPAATNLIDVSVGGGHVLGLRTDGTVVAWGGNECGQATVPASATNIAQISAGALHSLALRTDGTLLAWGAGFHGGVVPAGLSNVVQIAAGYRGNLALRVDGRVFTWRTTTDLAEAPVSNAVAIAQGGFHGLALLADGTLAAWGNNAVGQSAVPAAATNVIAIAAGFSSSAALRRDGTIVAWGLLDPTSSVSLTMTCSSSSSSTSPGSQTNLIAVPADATDVVAIAAGRHHLVALRADGRVIAWGDNSFGQSSMPPINDASRIGAGGYLTVALRGDAAARLGSLPDARAIADGDILVMQPATGGREPLRYQWFFASNPLAGQTNSHLVIQAGFADTGVFSIVTSNAFGSATGHVSITVTAARPRIVLQPAGIITNAGADVVLESSAAGTGPLHYQWFRNFSAVAEAPGIEGANSPILRLASVTEAVSGTYQLRVTNAWGGTWSSNATLIVLDGDPLGVAVDNTQLVWTTGGAQPWSWQNAVTSDGVDAAGSGLMAPSTNNWIATTVQGPAALEFWWRPQGLSSISDVLAFELNGVVLGTITGNAAWQRRSFWIPAGEHQARWVFSRSPFSGNYAAFLDQVRLTNPVAPSIVTAPVSRAVAEGTSTTFTVAAAGTEAFTCQWQFEGVDLPGLTNFSATLINVSVAQSGNYRAIVSNISGSATSAVAVLTVNPSAPIVQQSPVSRTVARGLTGAVTASAVGTPPVHVQWQFQGQNIPGATNLTLGVPNFQAHNAGRYRAVFQNEFGTTLTAEAELSLVTVAAWGSTQYGATIVPAWVGDVVEVAAGTSHSIALRRDGTVLEWGSYFPPFTLPGLPQSSTYVEVRSGANHAVGLTTEDTVRVAGSTPSGLGVVPANVSNVVAVAAGRSHNLVLTAEGNVIGWGLSDAGQTTAPPEAVNVVAIAGGLRHSLALREDGQLLAWGTNHLGQLDIPVSPAPVIAIASGSSHNMALLADGTVLTWGNPVVVTNQPADITDIVAIAAGDSQALALRQDGTLATWGANFQGSGVVPEGLANVVAMAHGFSHALAVIGDGRPVVTVHPYRQKTIRRASDGLYVRAVGNPPLSFQWHNEHGPIPGATNDFLAVSEMPASGDYFATVANALGTAVSQPAAVTLAPAFGDPPGGMRLAPDGFHLRLTQLSGRSYIVIYASTNLISWTPIHTNVPVAGVLDYVDTNAWMFASRMYRAAEVDLELGALRLLAAPAGAGAVDLQIKGLSGLGPVIVYGSTNLIQWSPLATNSPVIGSWTLPVTVGTGQSRYFFFAIEHR
jgi:alpha-tubulin suppressor-like RCC1 family protein